MEIETLNDSTYKITITAKDAVLTPLPKNKPDMKLFLAEVIRRLKDEREIDLPEGKLLAEAFAKSDGSCVIFVSAAPNKERRARCKLCAAEIYGIRDLIRACELLSDARIDGKVYCGENADAYRLIFENPPPLAAPLCGEFGEYGEITPLFAAQTEEYLTEISSVKTISSLFSTF